MKIGDLVIMRAEHPIVLSTFKDTCVGIIVDFGDQFRGIGLKKNRAGVLWTDRDGIIDYEPVRWLEVISESS